jgi:hypothetical protein
MERKRLSRRLEPIRQAVLVADEIIERTFSSRRTAQHFPAYAIVPSAHRQQGLSRRYLPRP